MGVEFTALPDDEPEFTPPPYSTPGRVLVRVSPRETVYKHTYEVLSYDDDTGVFWVNEGIGFDYFFDNYVDFKSILAGADEGVFVVEGIKGEYIRGRGWISGDVCEEDDEEWEIGEIRHATEEEIRTETLS